MSPELLPNEIERAARKLEQYSADLENRKRWDDIKKHSLEAALLDYIRSARDFVRHLAEKWSDIVRAVHDFIWGEDEWE